MCMMFTLVAYLWIDWTVLFVVVLFSICSFRNRSHLLTRNSPTLFSMLLYVSAHMDFYTWFRLYTFPHIERGRANEKGKQLHVLVHMPFLAKVIWHRLLLRFVIVVIVVEFSLGRFRISSVHPNDDDGGVRRICEQKFGEKKNQHELCIRHNS